MKEPVITYEQLQSLGACGEQRIRFRQLFGEQVTWTMELAEKHAGEFDWTWAAEHLLDGYNEPYRLRYSQTVQQVWDAGTNVLRGRVPRQPGMGGQMQLGQRTPR